MGVNLNWKLMEYEVEVVLHDTKRRKMQEYIKQNELSLQRIKEITELIEDETIAYWKAQSAIATMKIS